MGNYEMMCRIEHIFSIVQEAASGAHDGLERGPAEQLDYVSRQLGPISGAHPNALLSLSLILSLSLAPKLKLSLSAKERWKRARARAWLRGDSRENMGFGLSSLGVSALS